VDLDADGRYDILSGSYSRMEQAMAGLFQVLRGKEDGTFKKAEALNGTNGEPLIIPVKSKPGEGEDWIKNICTRPFAADWDGDGHLDLVVGNFPGTFYLFEGKGKGEFQPVPEEIKAGGQPLKIAGAHGDPFVIDWDGDGDLDLLSGSSEGGVQWAENGAGPGKPPRLEAFRPLIEKGPQVEYGQILRDGDLKGRSATRGSGSTTSTRDGKLDILVGDMAYPDLPRRRSQRRGVQGEVRRLEEVARGDVRTPEFGGRRREEASGGAAANPGAYQRRPNS
jgi:hypothetical protein